MSRPRATAFAIAVSFVVVSRLLSADAPPASTGVPGTPSPAPPPCAAPEFGQFDFWVGEWDVRDPAGNPAGNSVVTRILDGCVLREEWHGAGGGDGLSLTSYDAAAGTWRQTWVDSTARHTDLVGKSAGPGTMSLEGETTRGGRRLKTRLSWHSEGAGRLQQKFETSADGGATWKVGFEMRYTRRGPG